MAIDLGLIFRILARGHASGIHFQAPERSDNILRFTVILTDKGFQGFQDNADG